MEKTVDFFEAMRMAVNTAKKNGEVCYVFAYPKGTNYFAANKWGKGWLFRAFPGGRKELSVVGKAHAGLD